VCSSDLWAMGFKSAQTAHHHLTRLEEEGYIERGAAPSRKRRPLRLTEKGWQVVSTSPLLGRIAAGRGLEAVANEEPYSLAAELLSPRSGRGRFLLEARGDSMTGAGIEEGDLLVVEENPSPPNGSVVAALILDREEATVKVLRREGDRVRLKPRNGAHQDIVIPADRIVVQGTVEWVIRRVGDRR
jgi:repressor LexA